MTDKQKDFIKKNKDGTKCHIFLWYYGNVEIWETSDNHLLDKFYWQLLLLYNITEYYFTN